jgi:AcrR family transcriptional regulator
MPAAGPARDQEPPAPIGARRTKFAREFVAREIEEAAIALFAERGYENVTAADVAEAIGVSRRTFFRYFASKDHVLHAHALRLHARVIRALERRPSDESAATALCNAFLDTADVGEDERESMRLRNRVLRECQGQSGWATLSPEMAAGLSELVAVRMGLDPDSDLRPKLLVAAIWAAADAAAAHWVAIASEQPLTTTMRYAFNQLLTGLSTLGEAGATTEFAERQS